MKKKNKKQLREEVKKQKLEKIRQITITERKKQIMQNTNLFVARQLTQETLIEHYNNIYGKPNTDEEAVKQLCTIYQDTMNVVQLSTDVSDGIGEYYRLINHRGLPAYEWILEAIHVTSKKSQEKRNFKYIVGMLRQWLKYGFGHIPNAEETEVIDYFEEVAGVQISADARNVIENLMGTYGAIKVTRMIGSLTQDTIDMSLLKANSLKKLLADKYQS